MKLIIISLAVAAIAAQAYGNELFDCTRSSGFRDCASKYDYTDRCSEWEITSYCARYFGCSEAFIEMAKRRFEEANKVACETYAHLFVKNRGNDTGCGDLPELDKCISGFNESIKSCNYLNKALDCADRNGCAVKHLIWIEDIYIRYSGMYDCAGESVPYEDPLRRCLTQVPGGPTCRGAFEVLVCAAKAKLPAYRLQMFKERFERRLTCGWGQCSVIEMLGNALVCPKTTADAVSCQDEKSMQTCLETEVLDHPDKCRVWYQIRKCAGVGKCSEQTIIETKKAFERTNGVSCQDCTEYPSLGNLRVCTSEVPACSDMPALKECTSKITDSVNKCDVWKQLESCTAKGKCTQASVDNAKSDFTKTYQVRCY